MPKYAINSDVGRRQRVAGFLELRFERDKRNWFVGPGRKTSKPTLDIGYFYLFNPGCKIKTAHGLLYVVHSVATKITRDFHLHDLDFRSTGACAADEQQQTNN